ncbi:peptidoglycan DD-metalloendopeptidase family protein [Galbitalea sp. SE-J8]|uniref:peptidoglycan DD-metalloendopeptidase family protein n=1 Tax=Galbitalea sp. SE-J8 TaxID=3054952 RepID=UPI00259D2F84|nr:M23 family metallopeptidase [Galbitalea sp. SE-J8]MDM4761655.1 peptidoglycan DD-metalloendopeptidase family protein [Galbitalea sp. SE-J8]
MIHGRRMRRGAMALRDRVPRRAARGAASVLVIALLAAGGIAATSTTASATDYPTWQDVQDAKADVAKRQKVIDQIKESLKALEANVASTQAVAQKAGEAAQEADQAYQEQAIKAQKIDAQATDAATQAATSKKQAAELAAHLYRTGPSDLTMSLIIGASDADQTLYDYGMSEKLSEQWQGVYARAEQDQNTATSLADQAKVAAGILKQYKADADAKLAVANDAAQRAQSAFDEEQAHQAELETLLEIAQNDLTATQADYQKGVEERARQAELARQQQFTGSAADHGQIIDGWTNPAFGPITSRFGQRVYPFVGFHLGTDVGVACGGPEFAAHAGTVSYAGWNGVYGNFIRIDVGDGVQIEYGHIMNGGMLVHVGDAVTAGQLISHAGKTGIATGCHEHFGVRLNGLVTNPQPFLSARGITLGSG